MAKKYLTLEEAAARLSMAKDDLVKMRESGAVRGFADRGNWKFKVDDIEELARSRSADSDPDVPIMRETSDSGFLDAGSDLTLGTESSVVLGGADSSLLSDDDDDNFGSGLGTSDSDVRLVMDSGIDPGESSLILGEADDSDSDISLIGDADSDSDVMLVGGESSLVQAGDPKGSQADSDSDVKLLDEDSDSDVKLVSTTDSDSDIQLAPLDDVDLDAGEATDSDLALTGNDVTSDSDIRLTAADLGGTDSDVRLVADDDTGSDISLLPDFGSDSDVRLVADTMADGSDSDVQLIDSSTADLKTSDSDIALISSDDSAITLDLGDDDRSVLGDPSGIALGGDSSITLASESGISLEGPTDSGISLDLDMDEGITLADDDDSGISLGDAGDSGIALAPGADLRKTQPMVDSGAEQDVAETQFEIPSLSGEQSDFDIDALGDDGDTGVLDLQDSGEMDDAVFDLDDDESAEMDSLSDELELDDEFADDGDMEDLDVFEDDADFEDGFQSGESQGEMVVPTRAAAVETDWGTGPFVGLIISTGLLAVLGWVMADLVNSMWSWNEPNAVAGMVLGIFGGLF